MGRYRGRYRRRYYGYRSQDSQRDRISRQYGGIDNDIRKMFFSLDERSLKRVFDEYEREHGSGKRKYAEQTFQKWRSGEVRMGGVVSERLVHIVPMVLDFGQKYELVTLLWNRLRPKSKLSLLISPTSGLEEAMATVLGLVEAECERNIPKGVFDRISWLSSEDGVAAKALLSQVEQRQAEIATRTLRAELGQLLALARTHSDKHVSGARTIELPTATVTIRVEQYSRQAPRGRTMSHQSGSDRNEPDKSLSHRPKPDPSELAPIENPNDLLGEALKRMSPEKQREIVGKATDEALRLQVKQKEGQLDHEMSSRTVDQASAAANRLSSDNTEFDYRAEHRSQHGSVQVSVRSKKPPLSQRVGGCFVATAAYGIESHPAVIELRTLRDSRLRQSPSGRAFIASYYKHSPRLASIIAHHPLLRTAARIALAPLVGGAWILNRVHSSPVDAHRRQRPL